MATYADLTYYKNTYLGTLIADAAYPALALRASAVIDQIAFNRAAAIIIADTPAADVTAIKMGQCAVAEEMQRINQAGNVGGIKSESVGGHSTSYVEGSKQTQSDLTRYQNEARIYMGNTELLYTGLDISTGKFE